MPRFGIIKIVTDGNVIVTQKWLVRRKMSDKIHEIWNVRFVNRIIDSMADGVFTMDAKGRISSWNPSMERISGYTAKEALGKTCQLLQCSRCFGKNCPANIEKCRILEKGTVRKPKNAMLRHKDGHDVPVIKNASVVKNDDGQVIGIVETVTDMTELMRAREKG
jgi:two-component system response regulator HydG